MRRAVLLVFALLLLPASTFAADVRVSYLVDAKALKNGAPLGTPLTFELFATSACVGPVFSQVANVESVTLLETIKARGVKSAPKPPKPVEIRHVLTGVTPAASFYLKVTGAGVTPVTGACQLQHASVGGTEPPPPLSCPADSVISGNLCVDKYEASLWQISPSETAVIQMVKDGTATLGDLTGAGAMQVGCTGSPYSHTAIPGTFPGNGAYRAPLYAASIPGVLPSACVSAYQSIAACELSDKKLMSNTQWSTAAQGTPSHVSDNGTTDCNTANLGPGPLQVGSRSACMSTAGSFDMVGNLYEWTVDAGAWIRGGNWGDGTFAGVLTAYSFFNPLDQNSFIGLRCAR